MRYAELIELSVEGVENFLEVNPDHIAANNAIRELRRLRKAKKKLERQGRRTAVKCGYTKQYRKPGRTPSKKELI